MLALRPHFQLPWQPALYYRDHLIKLDGLDQVIIATGGECCFSRLGLSPAGKKDYRGLANSFVLPYATHRPKSINRRHSQIHKNDIGAFLLCGLDRRLAINCFENGKAAHLQNRSEHKASVVMILDDQDASWPTPHPLAA